MIMAKKPSNCSCTCAGPNQVNSSTRLYFGQAPAADIRPDKIKQTMPNLVKQNGPPEQLTFAPQMVFMTMIAIAISGTISNPPAKLLNVGSHAGTGVPAGMPHQVPKKIKVRNANSA